jgi:dihydrofolate reductase
VADPSYLTSFEPSTLPGAHTPGEKIMRRLSVSTLVSLDGVFQDPGGFGETVQGGWGNPYFTEDGQQHALEHLQASDYFLIGRLTYELLHKSWAGIKGGPYLDRMNEIPKLVASNTLSGSLEWNATVIKGDVAAEIARLKQQSGGDIEVYGSATLVQTLIAHDLMTSTESGCTRSSSAAGRGYFRTGA